MASPKATVDLEKELTCSICTDLLYQPLTLLDCLHTFCGACLKEWFSWQAINAENSPNLPPPGTPIFTCPSCRDPVRSTKHNATVVTLLDMLLTAHPEKQKPDSEKAEMDSKYKPGDEVIPRMKLVERTPEQIRLDEEEQRLIEQVQEISRQEAVGGTGSGGAGSSSRPARRRVRRDDSRTPQSRGHTESSRDSGRTSDRHGHSRTHESRERRHRTGTSTASADEEPPRRRREQSDDRLTPSRRDGHRSSSRTTAEIHADAERVMGHQSSLRSLISRSDAGASGFLDIEREIEDFARQIQEEGILDGLDLENIDVTTNDELSRRITEAYRRRQHGRTRQDGARRSNASAVSRHSEAVAATGSSSPPSAVPERSSRPSIHSNVPSLPPSSSRTSSRQRETSHSTHRSQSASRASVSPRAQPSASASASATSLLIGSSSSHTDRTRPPISNAPAARLEVRDEPQHHQRRRTASEGRSSTLPVGYSAELASRPNARSQTDLPLRPAEHPVELEAGRPSLGDRVFPAELPGGYRTEPHTRSTSMPSGSVELPAPVPAAAIAGSAAAASTASLPFRARASAMGLSAPGQPTAGSVPSEAAAEGERRRAGAHRPASIAVGPPTMSSNGFASSPVTLDGFEQPQLSPRNVHQLRRTHLFPEPAISCDRCGKEHIEYEVHYNCAICSGGNWNICTDCFRRGRGCLHWFGFGYGAWHKWEHTVARQRAENPSAPLLAKPHMLTANRYLKPRAVPGGADGRRTLTNEDPMDRLQSGVFCARCQAWANSCYWRCDVCNEGDWGFCNDCVNQGRSCTHPLLPLTHESSLPPPPPQQKQQQLQQLPPSPPHHLAELPSPPPRPHGAAMVRVLNSGKESAHIGSFWPLTFTTTCDMCRRPIAPTRMRYHCYVCRSSVVPDTHPGDYDLCPDCYSVPLVSSGKMANENGQGGWRRCPSGHRMVVVTFRGESGSGVNSNPGSPATDKTQPFAGAQRRVVTQDLVGGERLEVDPIETNGQPPSPSGLEKWSIWYGQERRYERIVSRDVRKAAGTAVTTATAATESTFPPSGGLGRSAVARWAWYPEAGSDDELAFPKMAEIREIEDVNGEWFYGVYMGSKGLFPGGYVKLVGSS